MQKLSRHSQISHVAEFGVKTRRLSSRFRLVFKSKLAKQVGPFFSNNFGEG